MGVCVVPIIIIIMDFFESGLNSKNYCKDDCTDTFHRTVQRFTDAIVLLFAYFQAILHAFVLNQGPDVTSECNTG